MIEKKASERLEELYDALVGDGVPSNGYWRALKAWADELQAAGKPLPQDKPRKTERAHPIYVCSYCKNPKNESDLLVGETLCVEGDKCKRISELEAKLAERDRDIAERAALLKSESREASTLRERLRLWEETREDGATLADVVLCIGELEHQWSRARRYIASLPPPVAPEPAEPPALTPEQELAGSTLGVLAGIAQAIGKISDSLPTSAEDERVVDELMAKRAAKLEGAQQKPTAQAPDVERALRLLAACSAWRDKYELTGPEDFCQRDRVNLALPEFGETVFAIVGYQGDAPSQKEGS